MNGCHSEFLHPASPCAFPQKRQGAAALRATASRCAALPAHSKCALNSCARVPQINCMHGAVSPVRGGIFVELTRLLEFLSSVGAKSFIESFGGFAFAELGPIVEGRRNEYFTPDPQKKLCMRPALFVRHR